MKINETCLALGIFGIVLFVVVSRPGVVVEGLSHKSTSIQRHGAKLTRAAVLQLETRKQSYKMPLQLYQDGMCNSKIVHRGRRSVKLCNCGVYGYKNANAFPGRKCSPTDHIMQ